MDYPDGGYDGGSMLEVFFWFVLIAVVLGAIIGLSRRRDAPAAPQIPMWPALPSFPQLTPAEAEAIAQANARGMPMNFLQLNPHTGQMAMFVATPHGHGHGSITLAQQSGPYPGYAGGAPFKSF